MRVDLHADIMFVNSLPFLLVKSGRLNYVALLPMSSKALSNITRGLLCECHWYVRRGMLVAHVHGDGDFDRESLRSAVKPAISHIHAPNKHVGVAKNSIKTVKECI